MAINKVIYNDETLIDLSSDTVNSETMLYGATAHDANGNAITGSVVAAPIDDTTTSTDKVWSSSKTSESILGLIDDEIITTETVWSSTKIYDNLFQNETQIINTIYNVENQLDNVIIQFKDAHINDNRPLNYYINGSNNTSVYFDVSVHSAKGLAGFCEYPNGTTYFINCDLANNIIKKEVGSGSGSGINVWKGTQDDFDAQKDLIPNDTYISILDDSVNAAIFDDAKLSYDTGWSSRKIFSMLQTRLYGVVLEQKSIPSSQTSVTFSDSRITTDSIIDVYDSIFGFVVKNITVTDGSCVVTFDAQSSTHDMKIVIVE